MLAERFDCEDGQQTVGKNESSHRTHYSIALAFGVSLMIGFFVLGPLAQTATGDSASHAMAKAFTPRTNKGVSRGQLVGALGALAASQIPGAAQAKKKEIPLDPDYYKFWISTASGGKSAFPGKDWLGKAPNPGNPGEFQLGSVKKVKGSYLQNPPFIADDFAMKEAMFNGQKNQGVITKYVDNFPKEFNDDGGVLTFDKVAGDGDTVKKGDTVTFQWQGFTQANYAGAKEDPWQPFEDLILRIRSSDQPQTKSSLTRFTRGNPVNSKGEPIKAETIKPATITFTVGDGKVIPGLDKAVVGMKTGGLRQIVVPQNPTSGLLEPGALRFIDKKETKSIQVAKIEKDGLGYPPVTDVSDSMKGLLTAKTFNPFPAESPVDDKPIKPFDILGPKPSTPEGQFKLCDFLDEHSGRLLFEMKLVSVGK